MFDKKAFRTIAVIIGILLLLVLIFGGRSPRKTAKEFAKSMLDARASKCYSLMSDEAKEDLDYETPKIAIHEMQSMLDDQTDSYIDKYGKSWSYKVSVVDVYDCDPISDEYTGRKMKKVVLQIEHQGGGLFNDKEGEEDITLTLVKKGRKWYVAD